MTLDHLPRVRLAHLPTPLEPLKRLSAALAGALAGPGGGPEIWIKRDDCTGLATGGNKARKLEYLMGAALERGAEAVATQGAVQSNHARQTAAAAARLGLECHVLLENRTGFTDGDYNENGNVLLDRLCGATVHRCPPRDDMEAALGELVASLPGGADRVYAIPGGGSNAIGAAGYANAAAELVEQAEAGRLGIDAIVLASGSAGTHAGMVTGLLGAGSKIPVYGVSVRARSAQQEAKVLDLARETAAHIGLPASVGAADIRVDDRFVGPGYGIPADSTLDAVRTMAELEGILLDPVYTGKAFAGLLGLVRDGAFRAGQRVVFLHTGGSSALFAYPGWFGEKRAMAA
ncbi:MAG: D-cysteine desulfhydrase [Rhodospirillaceae bacterium]|nr:D-cysteine desulfhydrase [Rhodospirillaceae bacterium]MYH39251.1 D-cysteine desulfhydrase [Rhodospirillaceae bacterium]MYK16125.1 D-cysteine desulfhydrase [Rhodospirillaceae bacterium]MYK58866.1 D-cysteine desulfhydrase [Rhodospirillaceae bacterium]